MTCSLHHKAPICPWDVATRGLSLPSGRGRSCSIWGVEEDSTASWRHAKWAKPVWSLACRQDAFRVLKPGGRLAIADTVTTATLPEEVRQDMALWAACISGAAFVGDLEKILQEAGFVDIRICPKDESRQMIREWAPGRNVEEYVVSSTIEAVKPGH